MSNLRFALWVTDNRDTIYLVGMYDTLPEAATEAERQLGTGNWTGVEIISREVEDE